MRSHPILVMLIAQSLYEQFKARGCPIVVHVDMDPGKTEYQFELSADGQPSQLLTIKRAAFEGWDPEQSPIPFDSVSKEIWLMRETKPLTDDAPLARMKLPTSSARIDYVPGDNSSIDW